MPEGRLTVPDGSKTVNGRRLDDFQTVLYGLEMTTAFLVRFLANQFGNRSHSHKHNGTFMGTKTVAAERESTLRKVLRPIPAQPIAFDGFTVSHGRLRLP